MTPRIDGAAIGHDFAGLLPERHGPSPPPALRLGDSPSKPAPPHTAPPTFEEDIITNSISAHAIASFMPPFYLAVKLGSLSRACAAAGVKLLQETDTVDLRLQIDDARGTKLGLRLAKHLCPDAVSRVIVRRVALAVAPQRGPGPHFNWLPAVPLIPNWTREVLAFGFDKLRELDAVVDASTASLHAGVVLASAPTLQRLALRPADISARGVVASAPIRLSLGRAISRCRCLKHLTLHTHLVDEPNLSVGAALDSLTLSGEHDDVAHAMTASARLIPHLAALSALDLSFVGMSPNLFGFRANATDEAAIQVALATALPRLAKLSVLNVEGVWTAPDMPNLRRLTWSGGGTFAMLSALLRHSPAATATIIATFHGTDVALPVPPDAGAYTAGAAVTDIAVPSLDVLRQLTTLPLTERLVSVTLLPMVPSAAPRVLLGSHASITALMALPPTVTQFTFDIADIAAPIVPDFITQQYLRPGFADVDVDTSAVMCCLAAFTALKTVTVTGAATDVVDLYRSYKQETVLRAVHLMQRARRLSPRVTFVGGHGAAVATQLLLPLASRASWMTALAVA